jgi:transposase
MRTLAMRFQGILRSKDVSKLEDWLDDASETGIYAMQRFVRTLNRDLDAVRNAVEHPWSNGQTEGQVNRLRTSNPQCTVVQALNFYVQECCRSTHPTTQIEEDPS